MLVQEHQGPGDPVSVAHGCPHRGCRPTRVGRQAEGQVAGPGLSGKDSGQHLPDGTRVFADDLAQRGPLARSAVVQDGRHRRVAVGHDTRSIEREGGHAESVHESGVGLPGRFDRRGIRRHQVIVPRRHTDVLDMGQPRVSGPVSRGGCWRGRADGTAPRTGGGDGSPTTQVRRLGRHPRRQGGMRRTPSGLSVPVSLSVPGTIATPRPAATKPCTTGRSSHSNATWGTNPAVAHSSSDRVRSSHDRRSMTKSSSDTSERETCGRSARACPGGTARSSGWARRRYPAHRRIARTPGRELEVDPATRRPARIPGRRRTARAGTGPGDAPRGTG